MIRKWITRIVRYEDPAGEEQIFIFGDGTFGNENRDTEATRKCLEEYIIYCNKQIELAKEFMK